MTAVEKAEELVNKMHLKQRPSLRLSAMEINLNDTFFNAKECALIAVDEILELICCMDGKEHWQEYYEQVKHELNKSE